MADLTFKELRAKTGMTQKQFAERFSLNIRNLQAWEQGRKNPPGGMAANIAEIIEKENITAPAGMITVRQMANKYGCTTKNIYFHINKHAEQLEGHIRKTHRFWKLDEYAQNYIRKLMLRADEE